MLTGRVRTTNLCKIVGVSGLAVDLPRDPMRAVGVFTEQAKAIGRAALQLHLHGALFSGAQIWLDYGGNRQRIE